MPHHLQADSTAGQRARVQTHPMLRSGILPSDELRSRLVEMSRLQVSFFFHLRRVVISEPAYSFLWLTAKRHCWRDWRLTSICGAYWTRWAPTAAALLTPRRWPLIRPPIGDRSIRNWWEPASRRRMTAAKKPPATAPRGPKWCHRVAWPYPPCPTGIWASPCPLSARPTWTVSFFFTLVICELLSITQTSVSPGIASGSMMTGMTGSSGNNSAGQIMTNNSMGSPFDNILNGGDWNSVSGNGMNTMNTAPSQDPLSNLMDSVNSLDPLNSMGKSLNEQVNQLSPCPSRRSLTLSGLYSK